MNILVCGDYSPVGRHLELLEKNCFNKIFGNVKSTIEENDYSIVNFETCVATLEDKPIKKHGPNLSCSAKAVDALKWVGFSCVTLANNHFRDFGENGVLRSLDAFKKNGIDYVGGGENLESAKKILFKQVCGETVAIINVCEHEFSVATVNHEGCNPIDAMDVYYDIQDAQKRADYVLVIVHGGHEHFQLPSLRMQKLYRFFIDAGADAVVNHHQHCFSGYEKYKGKPIFYGIGNFCFDNLWPPQKKFDPWNYGYMVQLKFFDKKVDFVLIPYSQCVEDPSIKLLDQKVFEEKIENLNKIIVNPQKLKIECDKFYYKKHFVYEIAFEPYMSRVARKLFKLGLLPHFLTKGKALYQLINFIECESHRDCVLQILKGKM